MSRIFVTFCRAAGLAAMCLLLTVGGSLAADNDSAREPGVGFYSYIPALPDIQLPDISIPFWTDDLKKAKRAYRNGNYERALRFFRRASDDGNIVADWYLGHMYRQGRGVQQNDATAYTYYSRVAEHYDPDEDDQTKLRVIVDAMIRQADYQRVGIASIGMKPSPQMAARTYMKIATTYGHPAAHFALGIMNVEGQGVSTNPQQGLKWLMAAARKRYAPAEAYLGELYWQGRIVKGDRTRAVMWYILARESAKPEENPEIYDRALQLEANVAEDELIEAQARAKVWDDQYPTRGGRSGSNE